MKYVWFILSGWAVLILACKENPAPGPVLLAPDTFKTGLGKVYEKYLYVQKSLADDDLVLTQNAFAVMHAKLHELTTDGMDSVNKAYWDSANMEIMLVLHRSTSITGDLAAVRSIFFDYSPMLLNVMERFGAKTSEPVLLFHCPMANENQGQPFPYCGPFG